MTDEPISHDDLDAIERRVAAASAGPWQSFVAGRDHWSGDSFVRVGGLNDDEPDIYAMRETKLAASEDLDLIAHARQDVPRLLAEVRRLRCR